MKISLDQLVYAVVSRNDEEIHSFDQYINEILNERIFSCAVKGFTTYLIQFTKNQHVEYFDETITTILFAPNDALKYKYSDLIKKYYEKQGLNVSNRHNNDDSIIISWNKDVLNHYGYEF